MINGFTQAWRWLSIVLLVLFSGIEYSHHFHSPHYPLLFFSAGFALLILQNRSRLDALLVQLAWVASLAFWTPWPWYHGLSSAMGISLASWLFNFHFALGRLVRPIDFVRFFALTLPLMFLFVTAGHWFQVFPDQWNTLPWILAGIIAPFSFILVVSPVRNAMHNKLFLWIALFLITALSLWVGLNISIYALWALGPLGILMTLNFPKRGFPVFLNLVALVFWVHVSYLGAGHLGESYTYALIVILAFSCLLPIWMQQQEVQLARLDLEDTLDARTMELRQVNARLYHLASTDELSGLLNRRSFFDMASKEIRRAQRYQRTASLLVLDLDHFKQINDRYGHLAGDEVIKTFSAMISQVVRENDIPGRIGGEEFAILLPETSVEQAMMVAEKIRSEAEACRLRFQGESIHFTTSQGVSGFNPDLEKMFHQADEALYLAKDSGRNCIKSIE